MSPHAREKIGDNEIYHIITRGNNRQNVFQDDSDFQSYLSLIAKYKERYPILLFHYCLMNNHVHLLLKVIRSEDLKRFMQGVSQGFSRYYKQVNSYVGHLWQGRYKSFHIGKDSYLLECGRYIERNPVRAGMVTTPQDWPWSSYRHYAYGETDPLIDEHGLYLDLGATPYAQQVNYRNYVLPERPYEKLLDKQFHVI